MHVRPYVVGWAWYDRQATMQRQEHEFVRAYDALDAARQVQAARSHREQFKVMYVAPDERGKTAEVTVMPIHDLLAARIEQMADGHYRRGLGGQTGGEMVRADWFKLAEIIRDEIVNENAIRHPQDTDH